MNGPDHAAADREERLGEVISDWLEGREAGRAPGREEWLARYPEFADELREFLDDEQELRALAGPLRRAAREARVDTPVPWDSLLAVPDPAAGPLPAAPAGYELLEEIGRGGMAVVYRARQTAPDRYVALKLFRADGPARGGDLRRFRLEADIIALLDHPRIVPVYDAGECDGRGFFTMKLVAGGGLDARLRGFVADPPAAARLLAEVARAVHHAHQRGVLHRDL
ncbi:MAG TPA: protein kinase, partial [Urbifossiella sp.]|nr:protein kinase [Urbifossiella sp.]